MKLLLIDGNSLLFRGYYATSYGAIMCTSDGVYTNAVYAFAHMINKAFDMIKPDYCVVAFDKGKHTFRHELSKDYKAGRRETPSELKDQFALAREMLDAYHIKYLEYDDIEADDIIGTLAKKYNTIDTCILSSDKDLYQLIDDTTKVYAMRKGLSEIIKLDEKELMNVMGLKPYQIIEYKGLAGDSSDNIKGVAGVGDKTAVKLLQEYDTCEGIYDHIDEIKGKLKEKLVNDKESCFLSKTLATIKTDVKIDVDLDDFMFEIDVDSKNEFFKKYEMNSLVTSDSSVKAKKVETKSVKKISKALYKKPLIYFASNELSYYDREIYGTCVCNSERSEYIKINDLLKDKDFIDFIESDKEKIFFDLKVLKHYFDSKKITIGKNSDDLMIMSFLTNSHNVDLENILNNNNLGYKDITLVYGTAAKPLKPSEEEIQEYTTLIATDLYSIYDKTVNLIKKYDMTTLYYEVELPLVDVLFEMEKEGINCDAEVLDGIAKSTKKKMNTIEKKVFKEVGHDFNLNSPAQLKEVLFNELGLPDLHSGSTNVDVLNKIAPYNPIVNEIISYRKYAKIYSTYSAGLIKYICDDNKIHTIFTQTVTDTGRLSSIEPNMQNISVRDEERKQTRGAFKPSKGNVLVSTDYSQIELRVLASLANETKMIKVFNEGKDIHAQTAIDVFKLKEDEVTTQRRRQAKSINFGVVYGISSFGLSNQTGLAIDEAKEFIDNYFETYPKVKEYLDNSVAFCQKNGYVKTILNRRKYIDEIKSSNFQIREFGKRTSMNGPIQGSAADLIKIAMVKVSERLKKDKLKAKLILQVHDELIFDVPKNEIDKVKKIIDEVMPNTYKLKTNLMYSFDVGDNWLEVK